MCFIKASECNTHPQGLPCLFDLLSAVLLTTPPCRERHQKRWENQNAIIRRGSENLASFFPASSSSENSHRWASTMCLYTHVLPGLCATAPCQSLQGAGSSPCGHPVRALKLSQGTGSPSPHNLTPYGLPPSSPIQSGLPASPTPPSYPIKLLQPWGLRSCKSIFSQQAQSNQVKKQISV